MPLRTPKNINNEQPLFFKRNQTVTFTTIYIFKIDNVLYYFTRLNKYYQNLEKLDI